MKEKNTLVKIIPCTITGPDGVPRQAWEMKVGGRSFGKAESKKSLLASYAKLGGPTPTGHWRENPPYHFGKKGVRRPTETKEKEFGEEHEVSFDA